MGDIAEGEEGRGWRLSVKKSSEETGKPRPLLQSTLSSLIYFRAEPVHRLLFGGAYLIRDRNKGLL